MSNTKRYARKYHKILGIIFALPLLWSASSGTLAVIIESFFNNEEFADFILKIHTLEILGLKEVYPFIFLAGVIGLVFTATIMLKKNK